VPTACRDRLVGWRAILVVLLEGQRPLLPRGGKAREQEALRPAFSFRLEPSRR
jgi:hypothetical protein